MTAITIIAGLIVFGPLAIAFLMVAISQYMMFSGLLRMQAKFPDTWRELGAPDIFSQKSRSTKVVLNYLRSESADELGDPILLRRVRIGWRLNVTGGVIFLLWIAFVIWINCIA